MRTTIQDAGFDLSQYDVETGPDRFSYDDIEHLPRPVQRYFIHVLMDGQRLIRCARFEQVGGFRLKPKQETFRSFQATESFTTERPGFLWQAEIEVPPILKLNVTDTYLRRQARTSVRLFSKVSLVNEVGKEELDQGALMRYLAEAVWFPTALLPSHRLSWHEVDRNCAAVTLRDGKYSVSGLFFFNEYDEICKFVTFERWREVKRRYVQEKFLARYSAYREFEGVKIPTKAQAAWCPLDGDFDFIRMRVKKVRFSY